jgi:hypothetical protein
MGNVVVPLMQKALKDRRYIYPRTLALGAGAVIDYDLKS